MPWRIGSYFSRPVSHLPAYSDGRCGRRFKPARVGNSVVLSVHGGRFLPSHKMLLRASWRESAGQGHQKSVEFAWHGRLCGRLVMCMNMAIECNMRTLKKVPDTDHRGESGFFSLTIARKY